MFEFRYDYIKPTHKEKAKLCYIDYSLDKNRIYLRKHCKRC